VRLRSVSSLAAVLAAALAGCTTGDRGSRRPPPWDPTGGGAVAAALPVPRPAAPDPDKIEGTPSILVMWEALAGERQRFANPESPRASTVGKAGVPVILVNASFVPKPEELRELRAQNAHGAVAKIPDKDMLDLVAEIEQAGFYRFAKPTDALAAFFASERLRGRITIERDGTSMTLVSQYGQGLDPATRPIPGIYSQVKNTILIYKNRLLSVGVSGKRDPIDPEQAKKGAPPAPK